MATKASHIKIPFFGLDRQYANLREEILAASDSVYKTGQVLDGPNTEAFETHMALRTGRKHAVAVNSCTQAIVLTLAASLPEKSKVLIPAISFAATVNAVLRAGHEPVFCDVDRNGILDFKSLDFRLHDRGVHAMMYVNLFGNIIDWDQLKLYTEFFAHGVDVFEDAAQSFGASINGKPSGSLGYASFLSFDPTKNLPNYGSGGMILTDSVALYNTLLDLRNNGKHLLHIDAGTNSRMSEADCAQMLVKLKYFDSWQQRRDEIASYYIDELLPYTDVLLPNEGVTHAWHKFVIRCKNRSQLKTQLNIRGIETKVHYDAPISDLIVSRNYSDDNYLNATNFTRECLSLPIYPELTDAEVEEIVKQVRLFFSS